VRQLVAAVTHGRGMVPVQVRLGRSSRRTSPFPKDGGYALPLRDSVRNKEKIALDDDVRPSDGARGIAAARRGGALLRPLRRPGVRDNGRMAEARILYEDGRPYTVPDSLEELTGPTTGLVDLPLRLDWSEQGRYDLSDERQRNLMYERVIRESMQVDDLRAYLHGPTLRRVWRQLWLPRRVRTLWESRFQNLANAA
jgi:hypothetical protein